MPERPLLILPTPGAPAERRKKPRGAGSFSRPTRERQAERLTPRLTQLQDALNARRTRLQAGPQGVVPEEVVVLETIGSVDGFIRAVERIEGMEWLAEIDEDDIPPDDDFFAVNDEREPRPDKPLQGRLFLIFTNQSALSEMLSLWGIWQEGRELPRGYAPWRKVFEQLRDVRAWGVQDRLLETRVLEDWRDRLAHEQRLIPCEIELWYRRSPEQRAVARGRVAELVAQGDGQILAEATIDEISYHALLAHLPAATIRALLNDPPRDSELVQCEQIQFFRASGQMATSVDEDHVGTETQSQQGPPPAGAPVVALLDGMPLQAHQRLLNRLVVDDPDDFESSYQANERRHGTAMASLIIHGDLAGRGSPLSSPLYVRPILQPDSRDWRSPRQESVSENTLVVDLVHRAVRRLFESTAGEPAAAPEVSVVNVSIGIRDRLFDGSISPLARLLDWLAWQYKVLFVVSAGNHPGRIELAVAPGSTAGMSVSELQAEVIRAVANDTRNRRLLSPAEAVNALTVGAAHADETGAVPPTSWIDPYADHGLPSPINAQGMGYRRAIKPELLTSGGRVVVQERAGTAAHAELGIYPGVAPPGQRVASTGSTLGDTAATCCIRGTSNATALVSRAAAQLSDVLEELEREPGGHVIASVPRSVWLKTLVAHGADWKDAATILDQVLRSGTNSRQFKEYVTRLLGYGTIDVEWVRECTEYRATAIGGGVLQADQSHVHRYPLPPSLSGHRGNRRLVLTLGWLTPVNPRHQGWRRADLWFAPPTDPLRVQRDQADWKAVQRGTLQHEVLSGDEAGVFVDGTNLEVQVSCRPDAGTLEVEIPYSLAITLEVAEEIGVSIYDEIRVRVQNLVRIASTGSD